MKKFSRTVLQKKLVRYHRSKGFYPTERCTIIFSTQDEPGALEHALKILRKYNINMTKIQSKYQKLSKEVDFYVDLSHDPNGGRVQSALEDLQTSKWHVTKARLGNPDWVDWMPLDAREVDPLANNILDGGSDLQADHPGFHDKVYRERRQMVAEIAKKYAYGDRIPTITYTDDEIACWDHIWGTLEPLLQENACPEYLEAMKLFQKDAGFSKGQVPQLQDVNEITYSRTKFRMRPCGGLLSSRDFLYGLAFRIFFSTQYLRHHTKPLYTPEPDLVHELVGHAPLFADPDFADFSQEIGLASLGATDEQIVQLARCYWFSVEFGMCGPSDNRKAYGAGLLSSFGELQYCVSDEPEIRPWDPFNAAQQDFPITTYQPIYYLADSFEDAKNKMANFSETLNKPFSVRWNHAEEKVEVDRYIVRRGSEP